MKKILILFIILVLFSVGCGKENKNITFTGIIEEIYEKGILVTTTDLDSSDKASVGFDKELEIDFNLVVGQKVEVTILPEIRESYPVQVTAVKIKLIEDQGEQLEVGKDSESTMELETEDNQAKEVAPVSSSEIITIWVAGDGVRLRAKPSTDAVIIGAYYTGDSLKLLERLDRWSKVFDDGVEGYINNDFLSNEVITTPKATQETLTVEQEQEKLTMPKIIVKKAERKLELWDGDELFDTYSIGLGFSPVGHKAVEGDGRTPEGTYYVCIRNANSSFYKSLGVSYPNKIDAKAALEAGTINQSTYNSIASCIDDKRLPPWNTAMGGQIMIHGHGGDRDWTAGCVAVDDDVMDILWKYCPNKTPIIIEA